MSESRSDILLLFPFFFSCSCSSIFLDRSFAINLLMVCRVFRLTCSSTCRANRTRLESISKKIFRSSIKKKKRKSDEKKGMIKHNRRKSIFLVLVSFFFSCCWLRKRKTNSFSSDSHRRVSRKRHLSNVWKRSKVKVVGRSILPVDVVQTNWRKEKKFVLTELVTIRVRWRKNW